MNVCHKSCVTELFVPAGAAFSVVVSFLIRCTLSNHHWNYAVGIARNLVEAVGVMYVRIKTEKVNESRMIDRRPGVFYN